MHKIFRVVSLLALCFLLIAPLSVHAQDDSTPYVGGIWATPCEDSSTLALYMTIANDAEDAPPLLLSGASSPIASTITMVAGGCDAETLESIDIPAGEILTFDDSDLALLVELAEDHADAEAFSFTLTFDVLDENSEPTDEALDLILGAPVQDEAPPATDLRITGAWVRPTASGMMMDMDMDAEGDDMDMDSEGDDMDMDAEGEDMAMDDEMDMGAPMFPSAAFMRLRNDSDTPLLLMSASSPVSGVTELHTTQMENDVMRMIPITDGIELPAGEWVNFQPGGLHVMLLDLQRDLVPGDAVPLTLTFESGEEITLVIPVYEPDMMDMDMGE